MRVEISRAGAISLPEVADVEGGALIGTLVRRLDDQIFLRVPTAIDMDGAVTRTLGQDVSIATSDIVSVEERQLNRRRTALVVGGGLATLISLFVTFGDGVPNPELPPRDREVELR